MPIRVEGVAQVLARLETNVLRRRNHDLFLRPRVPSFARGAEGDGERAESRDRAALAATARVGDEVHECIEGGRSLFLRDARLIGHGVDDVGLPSHRLLLFP